MRVIKWNSNCRDSPQWSALSADTQEQCRTRMSYKLKMCRYTIRVVRAKPVVVIVFR